MRYVIINADDFGISNGVCKAILQLLENQAITSTSLMTAAPNALTIMKRNGVKNLLGVAGVHLQLSTGRPLAPLHEIPSLLSRSGGGKFKDLREAKDYVTSEVEQEWRMQILTAQDLLCGPAAHLNTHHSFHRIPELFDIYVKLAEEFDLPMRGAVNGEIKERILNESLRASIAIVREWTGRSLDGEQLKAQLNTIAQQNPNEIIEVVSHPGFNDKYLEKISELSKARENDYSVLMSLAGQGFWKEGEYQLLSFKDHINTFARCHRHDSI